MLIHDLGQIDGVDNKRKFMDVVGVKKGCGEKGNGRRRGGAA